MWPRLSSTRLDSSVPCPALPCPAQLGYSSFIELCSSCGPKSNGQWIMDKAKRKILDKLSEKGGEWEREREREEEGVIDLELTLTPCSSCAYFLISRSRSSWHQIKRDERERSGFSCCCCCPLRTEGKSISQHTHTVAHTRSLRQLIHLAGCQVGQTEWRHLNAHKLLIKNWHTQNRHTHHTHTHILILTLTHAPKIYIWGHYAQSYVSYVRSWQCDKNDGGQVK